MENRNVLISGAGVAGPSLAYWLARHGFTPTIVERAARLRTGGQAVDFRGPAHLTVLDRMGLLQEIRRRQSRSGPTSFVDENGEPLATMSTELASGDVEILRGDLGRVLFDATERVAEYRFGDSITGIEQSHTGVRVTFEKAAPAVFDLVIGADGLHSAVRALVFGAERQFIKHLGYHVAVAETDDGFENGDGCLLHSVPGRTAGVWSGGGAKRAIFYFTSPPLACDRHDVAEQKRIVADIFSGLGWEVPRLVAAMHGARDFYFDSISEIHVPTLSSGRVALLGDAGYGGTIGGMGTGVAVVAAYVLASELAAAEGDHVRAFARYEAKIRGYAERCQRGARSVGSFMAPRTRLGVALRNRMVRWMTLLPGKGAMERIAMRRASDVAIDDYVDGGPIHTAPVL